jgi:hypothetical protein
VRLRKWGNASIERRTSHERQIRSEPAWAGRPTTATCGTAPTNKPCRGFGLRLSSAERGLKAPKKQGRGDKIPGSSRSGPTNLDADRSKALRLSDRIRVGNWWDCGVNQGRGIRAPTGNLRPLSDRAHPAKYPPHWDQVLRGTYCGGTVRLCPPLIAVRVYVFGRCCQNASSLVQRQGKELGLPNGLKSAKLEVTMR